MAITAAGSAALAMMHASDPSYLNPRLVNLTLDHLHELEASLCDRYQCPRDDVHSVLATAVLRRIVHGVLGKVKNKMPPPTGRRDNDATPIEDDSAERRQRLELALKLWGLPSDLRAKLDKSYSEGSGAVNDGPDTGNTLDRNSPFTWFDELERLKLFHSGSKSSLWRAVVNHPMTEYTLPKCQQCGQSFPGDSRDKSDDEVGLREVPPTDEERRTIRSGWYRGPRGPVVFLFACPKCSHETRWFRTSEPSHILNPNGWGRLCGEQEDLRSDLADYLGVPLRVAVPLDWDHTWGEFWDEDTGCWMVVEGDARNFAVRLDEGIGSWTRVLVISCSEEKFCEDVSDAYLRCRDAGHTTESGNERIEEGRADACHASNMPRYVDLVEKARCDSSGQSTQNRTVNGYLLSLAGMSNQEITEILRVAHRDYSVKTWWDIAT